MKNILAENMLRFGTKNLNPDILRKLNEQAQSFDPTTDPNFETFYEKLTPKSKKYWDAQLVGPDKQPISAEDKASLYQIFLQRAQKKAKIAKKDVTKIIKRKLTSVVIGVTAAEVKKEPVAAPPVPEPSKPVVLTGTWPNVKDPAKLSNFYLKDDATAVLPENINQFKLLIQDLLEQVPPEYTIENVLVYAGASTSQVPTTFQGGEYGDDIKKGQVNNKYLATARCNEITKTLSDLIKTEIPNFTGQVAVDPPQLAANSGPQYTQKERTYFFGTGKLDPTKQDEYDKTYGPYKGSYGGVTIVAKMSDNEPPSPNESEPDEIVTTKSNWTIRLTWKPGFHWDFKIPKIYIGPRGHNIVKDFRSLKCASWGPTMFEL